MTSVTRGPAGGSMTIDQLLSERKGESRESAKLREHNQKQIDGIAKMVVNAAKNQLPGEDSGSSQQSMIALAGVMAQVQMADGMQESISQLARVMHQNQVVKHQALIGKQVEVDDSTRNYTGQPVNFNYKLDFDAAKIPSGAMVVTVVKISDQDGNKVFEGRGAKTSGDHEFFWSGLDTNGKPCPTGSYKIQIESGYVYNSGGAEIREEIAALTSRAGTVDQIVSDGEMVSLIMKDGRKLDPEDIVAMSDQNTDEDEEGATAFRMSMAEASSLLGKPVDLTMNKVALSSGKGNVCFLCNAEQVKLAASGGVKTKIVVSDEGGKAVSVTTRRLYNLKDGLNSTVWNGEKVESEDAYEQAISARESLPKLPDGVYNVKVYIQGADGKYTRADSSRQVVVESIGQEDGRTVLWNGSDSYDTMFVSKVLPTPAQTEIRDWVEEGRKFLGRACSFRSCIDYTKNTSIDIDFALPLLADASKNYSKAVLEVTDGNSNIVQTVELTQDKILAHLPEFTTLNDASKTKLNTAVADQQIVNPASNKIFRSYENLLANPKGKPIAEQIFVNLLLSGELQDTGGNTLGPYNKFSWDGKAKDNTDAASGRYYYTVTYYIDGQAQPRDERSTAIIAEYDHDDKGLKLRTNTGITLRPEDVLTIVG